MALSAALVDRHLGVAVGLDEAVPGEVLAAVGHAGQQQAVHQALGQQRDDARVAVEGAVADHAAAAVVEVEHRREAEVDAAGAQLGAEHVAGGGGGIGGGQRRRCIHSSPSARIGGRWVKPSVRKRCTRPPSWSTQISRSGAHRLDLGGQLGELAAVDPVAREQDQAAGQRVLQAAAVVGGQRRCRRCRGRRGRVRSCAVFRVSTTTKVAA